MKQVSGRVPLLEVHCNVTLFDLFAFCALVSYCLSIFPGAKFYIFALSLLINTLTDFFTDILITASVVFLVTFCITPMTYSMYDVFLFWQCLFGYMIILVSFSRPLSD